MVNSAAWSRARPDFEPSFIERRSSGSADAVWRQVPEEGDHGGVTPVHAIDMPAPETGDELPPTRTSPDDASASQAGVN